MCSQSSVLNSSVWLVFTSTCSQLWKNRAPTWKGDAVPNREEVTAGEWKGSDKKGPLFHFDQRTSSLPALRASLTASLDGDQLKKKGVKEQ